jgi:hypothetical protein
MATVLESAEMVDEPKTIPDALRLDKKNRAKIA